MPWKEGFKRFVPVVPPLVGALLATIADKYGFVITPELNNAVIGLFLGAAGSSIYDTGKAVIKK